MVCLGYYVFFNLKIKFDKTLLQAGFFILTNGSGQVILRKNLKKVKLLQMLRMQIISLTVGTHNEQEFVWPNIIITIMHRHVFYSMWGHFLESRPQPLHFCRTCVGLKAYH